MRLGLTRPTDLCPGTVWLAPWSTWSFTFRLVLLLRETLHPEDPEIPCNLVDTDIYSLTWNTSSPIDRPDISNLPSLNHAIYLFNTVKFHLGQTYRLFGAEFEQEIRDFYDNAQQKATECRLWYVKFLSILAFGTAFLAPPKDSREPPGSKWFTRAMTLMPDTTSLWKDSLLAIEVLALAGIYLHSVDERESASLYASTSHHFAIYWNSCPNLEACTAGASNTHCADGRVAHAASRR